MKSYTQGRNLYGSLTKNTATANLTLGDELANDDYRALCAMRDWPWLERLRTLTTAADTQAYNLPYDCDQVRSISVEVSSIKYTPKKSPSRSHWERLNSNTTSSDIPEYWIQYDDQLLLWPTPTSGSNTIYVNQKSRVIDLSIADITNVTITTATAGSTSITVSGSLTAQMVGMWIRPTFSTTANNGDGLWYEIAGVSSGTAATLVRKYGGNSISAGTAACTISQMPLLPENFHSLPWIAAAGHYWMKEADPRGEKFMAIHGEIGNGRTPSTGHVKSLESTWLSADTDYVLEPGINGDRMIDPNLTILL